MAKDYQKELDALPEIKHLKSAIDQLQSDLTQGGLPFDTRQQLIHRLFRFDMVIGAVMTCDSIIKLQLNALTDDDRELHDQLEVGDHLLPRRERASDRPGDREPPAGCATPA